MKVSEERQKLSSLVDTFLLMYLKDSPVHTPEDVTNNEAL